MLMLDDENYVDDEYEAQATPARKAADAQRPSSQAYNDPDPSLDPLLACMPGMQLNEEDRDRFLQ
ncbi:hypothetical protein MMC14_010415, partial [Varicellaria rhodocarpa]|nr:hypothetical protein [Varicellaria rhodocarpa]